MCSKLEIVAEEQEELLPPLEHSHVLKLNFEINQPNPALYANIIPVVQPGDSTNNVNADGHLTFFKDNGNGRVTLNAILSDKVLYCIQLYGCIKKLESDHGTIPSALILAYFVEGMKTHSSGNTLGYPAVELISAIEIQFKILEWNTKEPHIAESDTGEMTIKFQCSKKAKISHNLTNNTGKELHHYTCVQLVENIDTLANYDLHVIFPGEGLWVIKLYENISIDKKRLVMKYGICTATAISDYCYPVIKFEKLLQSLKQKKCFTKHQNGLLKFSFQTSTMESFEGYICELTTSSDGQDERLHDSTYVSEEGENKYQLNAVFPHYGRWEVGVRIIKPTSAFSVISMVNTTKYNAYSVYPKLSLQAAKFKITIYTKDTN